MKKDENASKLNGNKIEFPGVKKLLPLAVVRLEGSNCNNPAIQFYTGSKSQRERQRQRQRERQRQRQREREGERERERERERKSQGQR